MESRAGSARITEIQGLRALAVILVVVYHAGLPVSGGFVGVDAFFVISGYVITRLLSREIETRGRIRFARFYAGRVRRLLPAASLVIIVTALAAMVLQSPLVQPFTGFTVIGSAVWLANGALFLTTGGYFSPSRETSPLLHMWSLAVEEQFYLVYPLLLALAVAGTAGLVTRRRRRTVTLLLVVIVVSGALSVLGSFSGVPLVESFAYYAPLTRAWEFALGALVCVSMQGATDAHSQVRRELLAGVGIVALIGSALLLTAYDHIPGYAVATPTIGTALVLASLAPASSAAAPTRVGRVLNTAPMQRIGDLSYSWYLWHWPLIVLFGVGREPSVVRSTIAGVIGLALSALTYRYVEERFRHASRPPISRIVLIGVGAPIALGAILVTGAYAGWGVPSINDADRQLEARPTASDVCLTRTPFIDRDMSACTFNAKATGKPIILLGDSTASHITDGVRLAALKLHRPLTVATAQSCAFVDLRVQAQDPLTDYCPAMYAKSVAWLKKQPPSTVVLENAGVWVDVDGFGLADAHGRWATSAGAKGKLWRAALERAYADVRGAGHDVVQVTPAPFFGTFGHAWSPRRCTLLSIAAHPDACGESMSRVQADRAQRRILAAERAATGQAHVRVIDIRPRVCRANTCSTNRGRQWVFLDGVHLSVGTSKSLAPLFEQALAATKPSWQPRRG